MSTSQRQTAKRVLASELSDATTTFSEDPDEERAPNFALLPTGDRANRIFFVGVLMETEDVGKDSEYWQAEIMDPAGDSFYVYAGQYQQEAMETISSLAAPEFVAVTGKPKTFETDEGDTMVSVRPESVQKVDAETRDRWAVEAAEQTLKRVQAFRADDGEDEDITAAKMQYSGNVVEYLEAAIEALEQLESDELAAESEGEAAAAEAGGAAEAAA